MCIYGYDLELLLDMDLLSFDRLMDQSREIRAMHQIEEARILRLAVGSAFSGETKAFDEFVRAYTPEALREKDDQVKIAASAKKLQRLFGG